MVPFPSIGYVFVNFFSAADFKNFKVVKFYYFFQGKIRLFLEINTVGVTGHYCFIA